MIIALAYPLPTHAGHPREMRFACGRCRRAWPEARSPRGVPPHAFCPDFCFFFPGFFAGKQNPEVVGSMQSLIKFLSVSPSFRAQGTASVVVGTPARLLELARGGSLGLSAARFLVLDEADQMLAARVGCTFLFVEMQLFSWESTFL